MRKEKGGGGASAAGHAPRRSSPPSSPPLAGDEGDPGTASPDSTATQGIKPPRLSAFVPCMSLTAFVPYVDVWAFMPYVDVWAFVPYICCRPSCRLFSCRFWKPPHTGEVLLKFLTYSIIILLLQSRTRRRGPRVRRRPRSSSSALRSYLHSVTSPLPR